MPHGNATGQCHYRAASNYDKTLKGHTFETFKADRPSDCVIKCENEPRCQSYNFVIGEKICELNNRTKEARPEDFVTDPARVYMTVESNRGMSVNTASIELKILILGPIFYKTHLYF